MTNIDIITSREYMYIVHNYMCMYRLSVSIHCSTCNMSYVTLCLWLVSVLSHYLLKRDILP